MGAALTVLLAIETWPARISAFSRERDRSATCAASTRSSRADPSLPVTVTSCFPVLCRDEPCMIEPDYPEPSPEQALLLSRVRRMMLIAGATTGLAIAAILVAIGYRLYTSEGSGAIKDVTATLPRGARISATAVAGDQLVLMLDVGGMTEIRTFDAKTLKPSGRLTFTTEP